MPNPQFAPEEYDVSKSLNYDKETMAQPYQQGPERIDKTGQRGNMDPGGNMPMRYGTADWKQPGGFKTQPRDRSWGMRVADGNAYDKGLSDLTTEEPDPEETYIDRGSVSKSSSSSKGDRS